MQNSEEKGYSFITACVLKTGLVKTVPRAHFLLLLLSLIILGISAIIIEKSTEPKVAPYVSPRLIDRMESLHTNPR